MGRLCLKCTVDMGLPASHSGPSADENRSDFLYATDDYGKNVLTCEGREGSLEEMKHTSLILIAHGSKNPEWAAPFLATTTGLREEMGANAVYLSFMENGTPDLPEAVRQAVAEGADRCRFLPMFMAKGAHFTKDIPALLAEIQQEFPDLAIELLEPIGLHQRFLEMVRSVIKTL